MFDPETLRTFIAVAETGSFSKAAERLCKTTATISYRIKLLEENTGVALFFRTTRSVTLTAAGEHLLSIRFPDDPEIFSQTEAQQLVAEELVEKWEKGKAR